MSHNSFQTDWAKPAAKVTRPKSVGFSSANPQPLSLFADRLKKGATAHFSAELVSLMKSRPDLPFLQGAAHIEVLPRGLISIESTG